MSMSTLKETVVTLIGSRKGFRDMEINRGAGRVPQQRSTAHGTYCQVSFTTLASGDIRFEYKSGAGCAHLTFKSDDDTLQDTVIGEINRRNHIAKFWHRGATEYIRDYVAQLDFSSFAHEVSVRECFNTSHPFAEIVLAENEEIFFIRINHEGYLQWLPDHDMAETTIDPAQLVKEPVKGFKCSIGKAWRAGSGLLFTPGVFSLTTVREHDQITFTPSSV